MQKKEVVPNCTLHRTVHYKLSIMFVSKNKIVFYFLFDVKIVNHDMILKWFIPCKTDQILHICKNYHCFVHKHIYYNMVINFE